MTATILNAHDTEAARKRKRARQVEDTGSCASTMLPPVSTNLVDALFHAESDQRQEHHAIRRAA